MKPTPPKLPGSFLVGHTFQFMKDRESVLKRGFDSLGSIFAIKLANRSTAVLIGPEYQQTFFTETDKKLSMHKTYQFVKAALGEVAMFAPPEIYEEQQPILHRPFKSERMASHVSAIQLEVQQWLDLLGKQGEIELTSEIRMLIQNMTAHVLMGKAFRDQMGDEFWKLNLVLSQSLNPVLPPHLPLPRFIRRNRARKRLQAIISPIIAERRANPDKYDDALQDLVNDHYKDGRPVEDEVILNLILSFMFGGYETTAGQAAWTIIQLLQHPDYLGIVQQEITDRLPYDQPISVKMLRSLDHVLWAVQETARMHPSADMLMRRAEEDIEVGQYCIPQGWNVIVSASIAHRLPTVFTEPQKYDPRRFAPDREEDCQHRFAMIGFGGGIHKCAGINLAHNEMMIITSLLFQQFDLELVTKDPQVVRDSVAVSRPEKTVIRYFRKQGSVVSSSTNAAVNVCPYNSSENIS